LSILGGDLELILASLLLLPTHFFWHTSCSNHPHIYYISLCSCTCSTKYNKYKGHTSPV